MEGDKKINIKKRKGGGGGKPPGRNQNNCFFSEKDKKMQNVLKRTNMQKCFVIFIARVSVKTR